MLKELACGQRNCKTHFQLHTKLGETHNPLPKAFHHG